MAATTTTGQYSPAQLTALLEVYNVPNAATVTNSLPTSGGTITVEYIGYDATQLGLAGGIIGGLPPQETNNALPSVIFDARNGDTINTDAVPGLQDIVFI